MKLSVVIPAYNEEGSIAETVTALYTTLSGHTIPHEIFVTNDNSKDQTAHILQSLMNDIPTLTWYTNPGPNGFGYAVRCGLERASGDCVAIMMADLSDSPEDLVRFYMKLKEGDYDCVFGSRFSKGGAVHDYPLHKLILNRLFNTVLRLFFDFRYNDYTNAFKLYKRTTLEGLKPFLSPHFNLTIELPLKAIVRGYRYTVLPNSWTNRKSGESKLRIREMGSRYFFIFLYCLIERFFSRKDFYKTKS